MDINKLMKQAQEIQKKMQEKQEELKEKEIEVSVGGGMVRVTMNGAFELVDLFIDDEIILSKDKDMLKDLVISAVNEAKNKIEEISKEELSKITGGMGIPGF